MAEEYDKTRRTLLIAKYQESGKTYYTIYPMSKIQTDAGEDYLEPLPHDGLAYATSDVLKFTAVEFIEPPGGTDGENASMLDLINFGARTEVRDGPGGD